MLLPFHIVSISLLIAVVGAIGYHLGKTEGIRITTQHFEALAEEDE